MKKLPDSVVRQLNKERDILCYEISVIRSSSYYNNKRQPTYSRKAFAILHTINRLRSTTLKNHF